MDEEAEEERVADTQREGEGEPELDLVTVVEVEGQCDTDTEADEVLVKGWVVPMAELVELGIQVRVAPDWLAPSPSEPLEDALNDTLTLGEGDALGDTVPDALRH
jgi:hypothetical protein